MSKTEDDLDVDALALDDDVLETDAHDGVEDADDLDDLDEEDVADDERPAAGALDDEPLDDADAEEAYELPDIVIATDDGDPDDVGDVDDRADPAVDRGDDAPDVSTDVLEELRRADIDGPVVDMAPQDDTSSAIRRPKRPADYDPAPFPVPMTVPRMLGRKPRVRRVTRVVRHVDPWSVFKIALVAHIVLYLIVLTAGVLLWNVAYATGTVDNVERFFESFGWSSFEFNGGEIYHNAWIGGLFMVIGLTGLAVLLATLFNLITDLVGGMRFTVLEEEVVEARPSPMRRFVVRRAEPEVPAVSYDESGPIVRDSIVDDSGSVSR
jgi:hypothetical protein